MDGGKLPMQTGIAQFLYTICKTADPDLSIRSISDDALVFMNGRGKIVEVLSITEFGGKVTRMPEFP